MTLKTVASIAALAALLSASAPGAPVSPERAYAAVGTWVARGPSPSRAPTGVVKTFSLGGTNAFHFVALGKGGFAVVPCDDSQSPILGFCEEGDLADAGESSVINDIVASQVGMFPDDEDGAPMSDGGILNFSSETRRVAVSKGRAGALAVSQYTPGCSDEVTWEFLETPLPQSKGRAVVNLKDEYQQAITNGTAKAKLIDVRVPTLTKTKWSQADAQNGYCYNYYTPNHRVCGCTATAVAQIIKYYGYPVGALSNATYTCSVDGVKTNLTTMAGKLRFDLMPDDPQDDCHPLSDAERQAIGMLCYNAGVVANMSYASSSGANWEPATRGLKGYFGYASADCGESGVYVNTNDIVTSKNIKASLANSLLANLDAGCICGVEVPKHSTVGDGYGFYNNALYCSINVGWGGGSYWFLQPSVVDGKSRTVKRVASNINPTNDWRYVTGRALKNGKPVSGVTVTAKVKRRSDGATKTLTATTNTNGIYAVRVENADCDVSLTAAKAGCVSIFPRSTTTTGGSYKGNSWGNDIEVLDNAAIYMWKGGASGKFSVASNWTCNSVPTNGAHIYIGNASAATINNDIASFKPASVTFLADSAAVTIDGNAMTGVNAVTNLSSVSHTVNAPVYFADQIRVKQGAMAWKTRNSSKVVFAGGAYGTTIDETHSRFVWGHYVLSDETTPFVADQADNDKRYGILYGSSLTVPCTTNASELANGWGGDGDEEAGGAFTTGVYRVIRPDVCCFNQGSTAEFVVTDELSATLAGSDKYLAYKKSDGAFKFEKVTLDGTAGLLRFANYSDNNYAKNVWIGAGGLSFADGTSATVAYCCGKSKTGVVRLRPWRSGYTIGKKSNSTYDFVIATETHFGTTDENGVARTVTCDGIVATIGSNVSDVFVEGDGRFVVNAVNTHTGSWTVTNTATLAVNAGKKVTSGAVTVNSGATLEVSGGGTSCGALTMAGGSMLVVSNLTASMSAAVQAASLAVPAGTVTVKVRSDVALSAGTLYPIVASAQNLPAGVASKFVVDKSALAMADKYTSASIVAGDAQNGGNARTLYLKLVSNDFYWLGTGANGNWVTGGNWLSGVAPSGSVNAYFDADYISGSKTAVFGAAESYGGDLYVAAGTAADPVVFQADAAGKGLSASKLSLGTSASGALWLNGGSYSFSDGVEIGGGAGCTGYLKVDSNLTVSNLFRVGCNSGSAGGRNCFELNGGTVKYQHKGNNYAVIGYSGGAGVTNEMRVTGGQFSATQHIYVGGSGAYGALTVDGGSVKAGSYVYVAKGAHGGDVTLNGGTLSAQEVLHGGGAKNGNLTFNGGTLKAKNSYGDVLIRNDEKLVVTVGENGGTIDNGNQSYLKYITIAKTMVGTGALTLTGSYTTKFTADQSYTGTTTNRTTLAASGSGVSFAGNLVFASGSKLAVTNDAGVVSCISAADISVLGNVTVNFKGGDYEYGTVILTKTGEFAEPFSDAEVGYLNNNVTGLLGAQCLSKSMDGKSIVIGNGWLWVGGASGNFSVASNWLCNKVPGNGAHIYIGNATAATLNNDIPNFKPASVTFLDGSAAVTINGNAMTGVNAVTNLSASVQTVACGLAFEDNYCVHSTAEPVNFSGGAMATFPAADMTDNAASHTLMGVITFTADWEQGALSNSYVVPDGSHLYAKDVRGSSESGGQNGCFLVIEEGGVADCETAFSCYGKSRMSVKGELNVSGLFTAGESSVASSWDNKTHVGYVGDESGSGSIRASGLWKYSHARVYVQVPNLYIGKEGIGSKEKDFYITFGGASHTVYATDDFEIFGPRSGGSATDWCLKIDATTKFNTQGHTVTWTGGAQGSAWVAKEGTGTLVMNPHGSSLTGPFTVEAGTLKVAKSGATGTGRLSARNGSTLAVVSGVTISNGAVQLDAGSTLDIVGYTDAATPMTLAAGLSLPSDGKVGLKKDGGAFGAGTYAIYRKGNGSVSAEEVADAQARFEPQLASGMTGKFVAEGDTLSLVVADLNKFNAGDKVGAQSAITLDEATAEWLNGLGAYATVKSAISGYGEETLSRAHILNLDVTKPGATGSIGIGSICLSQADDGKGGVKSVVSVMVALSRTHAVQTGGKDAPINGKLKLYSSDVLDDSGYAECGEAVVIDDDKFANGNTAECDFDATGKPCRFFKAKVE